MKNDKIITINGRKIDIATGKPPARQTVLPDSTSAKRLTNSAAVHSLTQKSQTLYRRATQKPVAHGAQLVRKVGRSMDIARSKSISHFAPRPLVVPAKPTVAKRQLDIGPAKHPIAAKVEKIRLGTITQSVKSVANKPSKIVKEEAIAEALKKPVGEPKKEKTFKHHLKFINTFSISAVLFIIIGCLVYYNMPVFSVNIASAQAGIKATYPEYHPDGYSLSGPVSYSDGQVTISFHANTGDSNFTIEQSKSSWDSTAVKNKISKDSNGGFITTEERGLTIYTYNGNAAWVNGGILYTISGNAPLSGDQIRRIATSL